MTQKQNAYFFKVNQYCCFVPYDSNGTKHSFGRLYANNDLHKLIKELRLYKIDPILAIPCLEDIASADLLFSKQLAYFGIKENLAMARPLAQSELDSILENPRHS